MATTEYQLGPKERARAREEEQARARKEDGGRTESLGRHENRDGYGRQSEPKLNGMDEITKSQNREFEVTKRGTAEGGALLWQ